LIAAVIGIGAIVALTGCDSDSESAQAALRIIHGSPDAPAVNAKLNGAAAIADIDYAESTGYVNVDADTYEIAVEGIIPGGNADVITVPGVDLAQDSRTTIVAVDAVASIEELVVADSAAIPTSDEVALQVLHASPAAEAATGADGVDIYVTAFGTDINTEMPVFNFSFKDNVDAGALPAGVVQIRATVGGTKDIVFDSGEVDLGPFGGQKLLVIALDTVNPTTQFASLISLLVATDSAQVMLYDAETQAGARVVHASPDATAAAGGDVEVWATTNGASTELIDAFGYLDVVPNSNTHVRTAAGDYVFNVAAEGTGIPGAYTSPSLSLAAGSEYTVIASGRITAAPDFGLLVSADDSRAVATQASVKVVHSAPAAGDVQVFVTVAGDFSPAEVLSGAAGDPLLDGFAYGDLTDYVALAPGDYDVRVVAGAAVAIDEQLTLGPGSVSTIIAVGPGEPAPPAGFDVVLLTN
jgi:hypothetical protein